MERLGAPRVLTDHQCVGLEQDDRGVSLRFRSSVTGATRAPVTAGVASQLGRRQGSRSRGHPGGDRLGGSAPYPL
jgi:hypothetical protein